MITLTAELSRRLGDAVQDMAFDQRTALYEALVKASDNADFARRVAGILPGLGDA